MTYSPPKIKNEDCFYPNCDGYLAVPFCCKDPLALPALKAKLAQPEQGAAWQGNGGAGYNVGGAGLAKPKQEPVAWHHPECAGECVACLIENVVKEAYGTQGLDYLRKKIGAPPKREWVGLTDEEVKESINNLLEDDPNPLLTLADVIQERLKEKNT